MDAPYAGAVLSAYMFRAESVWCTIGGRDLTGIEIGAGLVLQPLYIPAGHAQLRQTNHSQLIPVGFCRFVPLAYDALHYAWGAQ